MISFLSRATAPSRRTKYARRSIRFVTQSRCRKSFKVSEKCERLDAGLLSKLELYMFANAASRMCYFYEDSRGVAPYIESFSNRHDIVSRLGCLAQDHVQQADLMSASTGRCSCARDSLGIYSMRTTWTSSPRPRSPRAGPLRPAAFELGAARKKLGERRGDGEPLRRQSSASIGPGRGGGEVGVVPAEVGALRRWCRSGAEACSRRSDGVRGRREEGESPSRVLRNGA